MTPIVYTVGHGRRSFASVRDLMDRHGVTLIIDVRSEPTSGSALGFRKSTLEHLARVAGIGYRWTGDALGDRPSGRDHPTPASEPNQGPITESAEFAAAVDQVAALATGGPVALLCAEVDPACCHRALAIAPALEARGVVVRHILADGSAVPHQPPLDLGDSS